MKKVFSLVIKSYLGPLIMTFFIALFVLLLQFVWKYVDELVGKGLEWYIIAKLLFYASSTFVPMALPLAVLLSSLMTFGSLGEHYELVAMKSVGISLRKIMMPLITVSVILTLFAFYFSNNVLPVANLKFRTLLYDIRKQKLSLDFKEGLFYNEIDDYVIRIGEKDKDGNRIRDIMIYDHSDKRDNVNLTVADSGLMQLSPDGFNLIFVLYDGYNYLERTDQEEYEKNRAFQKLKFREEIVKFNLSEFQLKRTDENLFKKHYQMFPVKMLKEAEDSLILQLSLRSEKLIARSLANFKTFARLDSLKILNYTTDEDPVNNLLTGFDVKKKESFVKNALSHIEQQKKDVDNYISSLTNRKELIYRHQTEWHRKFTLSIACLILFFVGAPLGAIIRKGGLGLPVVISVFFFVIYYVISMISEESVEAGVMDANFGMWISSLVVLPIGVFLTYKATNDAPLLDADSWKKIFSRLRLKKK